MLKNFREKLIWQIIPVMLVVLIPAFFIGGYFACKEVENLCLGEQKDELSNATKYIEQNFKSNPNYEWLLTYWSENADALSKEIIYDSPQALEEARQEFLEINPGYPITSITISDLEKMDERSVNLYAQICLMDNTLAFNRIKEIYKFRYVYMVKVNSSEDELFLISGLGDGEKRGNDMGDIFLIGNHAKPGFEYHPVFAQIYNTHQPCDELEEKKSEGRTGYAYSAFAPIFTSDGSTYIIGCSRNAGEVVDKIYSRARIMVLIFVIVLIIGTLLMVIAFYQVLLKPLDLLQNQIRKYTLNKNTDELTSILSTIKNENEIGQLSSDIKILAVELERHTNEIVELSATNERIETELSLARRIQRAALPSKKPEFENYNNFDLSALMIPAKEVGGDFYDYFKIDEDHLAIIIADVSGKGIPAAMFMMLSLVCIKNMAKTLSDPGEILEKANEVLTERNEMEMFVTVWFGIMDLSTGVIESVNAGHENPVIYRKGEGYSLYKSKHGFVLAGMEGMKYKTEKIQLNRGDSIFLYTDGVAEATNKDNELYGTTRLLSALSEVSKENCDDTLVRIKEDIDEFVKEAPQFDDITMLCLEYT